jgi:hypothetical protein
MTETLNWCAHARVIKAKLCKVVYILTYLLLGSTAHAGPWPPGVVYMVKILKETMSPYMIRIIYFSNFESCLRNGIIFWGGDRASDSIFKLQKRVLRVISGVSSRTSCRQIFIMF